MAATPEGRAPAVFMLQPKTFETVAPERLAEWERSIQRYVGLPAADFDQEKLFDSATWSNCGQDRICADDSDYLDVTGDYRDPSASGADRLAQALAEGRRPSVFMFQPSRFERVGSDRLSEWEDVVRNEVGLPASRFDAGAVSNSGTLSVSLPDECMDDSDYESE
jgi:hypothetical protein